MKQEIKKEVVLQMIWDRHFDLGMEKDLDDICEDIYNEVFVLLLGKARKETANEIFGEIYKLLNSIKKQDYEDSVPYYCADVEEFDDKLYILAKQFSVEVE